jgi:hypothetical protein
LVASDFENATYSDTGLDLVGPSDPPQRYYELDVTNLVLADYAADNATPLSAFRLQVEGISFVEDDQGSRYRLAMPGAAANHPQLVLTLMPEPSTQGIVITGALCCALFGCPWLCRC